MKSGSNAVTTGVIKQWDRKLLFEILDNIHDVVLVIDSDSAVVYANRAYAEILGIPVRKVLGRKLSDIEPQSMTLEVLESGVASYNRKSNLPTLGIEIIGSTFPLFEGDKIIGCVSIFNNISEMVRLNRELQLSKGVADYLQEQINRTEQLPFSFNEYIGQNSRLQDTLLLAARVAKTESTVLIRGESGVGKDVLAKCIHNYSRRKDKPLIKVNCAAIPETLLESELFGFEDGAFTGAKKGGKLGKFELAHGGTIFLDEIGDMSINMQAKLLRVLQEREFERVGGTKTVKVDIRVIAATNRELESMMDTGTFRRDLYYRLNIVPLWLPPLRERKDDIVPLSRHFLAQYSPSDGEEITLSPQVVRILRRYTWPGNVRELQNVLEHACIVCGGGTIEPQHLPPGLVATGNTLRKDKHDLKKAVAKLEKEMILAALADNNNNRSLALKALGISRRSFYNKLHRFKIAVRPD